MSDFPELSLEIRPEIVSVFLSIPKCFFNYYNIFFIKQIWSWPSVFKIYIFGSPFLQAVMKGYELVTPELFREFLKYAHLQNPSPVIDLWEGCQMYLLKTNSLFQITLYLLPNKRSLSVACHFFQSHSALSLT